jgi:GT2 family glycosyltransferase
MTVIVALIVVYGEHPLDTVSYKSLKNQDNSCFKLKVVFWDNSPEINTDEVFGTRNEEYIYIHTPENLGLSVIYNNVINEHLSDDEFLLILDQDSNLPTNFISGFYQSLSNDPSVDLFLPLIKSKNRVVSPLNYFYGWGKYWKTWNFGLYKSKNISAINSGMIISAKYLKGAFEGYDERILFYGTDTYFMISFAEKNKNFILMNSIIEHDLSFFAASSEDKCIKFKSIRKANFLMYKDKKLTDRFMVFFVMSFVSILYAMKYKKIHYLYF